MEKLTADKPSLTIYLKQQDWLGTNEKIVSTEKPGDGNMNFTLRVITDKRSFILKQSRGYVEKYPQVSAPADRALNEAEFYELVATKPQLDAMMPELIGVDSDNNVLLLEDLGSGSDYTHIYKKGETIPEVDLMTIIDFAAQLHTKLRSETTSSTLQNLKMRTLNHEHIFKFPYMLENGLNLDTVLPGLQEIGLTFKKDEKLKKAINALGYQYLADGDILLHGDYFPGSWLNTSDGIKIIDPEFCFFGFAEFEIGVTIAHLKMADQPKELIDKTLSHYSALAKLDDVLTKKFTAVEVLRRILGLAQLPLEIDLDKRKELLEEARMTILS